MQSKDTAARRTREVDELLERAYPDADCALTWSTPFTLLVATILSAQCTDERVNSITPELFRRWPTAIDMAAAHPDDVAAVIKPTGFQTTKARNIVAMSQQLVEEHGGSVPADLGQLVALAGVGRKTANVVLGNAFNIPGLPVDTHVGRVATRLGLIDSPKPIPAEKTLCAALDPQRWTHFSHRMIAHGRSICRAKKPACTACVLVHLCPTAAH